jgi:hypothetical protein
MNLLPDSPDFQEQDPQAVKLDNAYDCCLLGATIGLEADRFVYSVSKLLRFERARIHEGSTAEAREALAEIIIKIQREHGPMSPVFVNDELLNPVEDGDDIIKSKIVTPGDAGFRRPKPLR